MPVKTVLVVDDDDAVRLLIARLLGRLGFRVIEAADAGHALALHAAGERIDLVITDFEMPGLSGVELLARLRAQDCTARFLLCCGAAHDDSPAPWLLKPFTLSELRHGVERAMAG